jgi:hypothetical protein
VEHSNVDDQALIKPIGRRNIDRLISDFCRPESVNMAPVINPREEDAWEIS